MGYSATPAATATPAPAAPAPQMPGSAQPNVFGQASQAYNRALAGPQIGQFFNPFTQAVTQQTIQNMNGARNMAMNDIGAAATAAGAFGGSRHGIAEAETNRAFFDQVGQTAGNLNMQGYNNALGAAQNQQQMMSQLAGQGFGFGQQLTQQQMAAGSQQQALQQMLIDAAKAQYGGFTGAPQQALTLPMAAVSGTPYGQSTTQTQNPGLLGILGTGASLIGALCWVAREVYGEQDPRWMEFREWLTEAAPTWLLKLYAKHGERAARVVRRVPILKRVLRPLMDAARRSYGFAG